MCDIFPGEIFVECVTTLLISLSSSTLITIEMIISIIGDMVFSGIKLISVNMLTRCYCVDSET